MVSVVEALRTVDWEGMFVSFYAFVGGGGDVTCTYGEQVVGDKVCDFAVLLDDVAPHDVFGGGGAEQVLDLGVCEFLLQVEAVEVTD